MKTMFTEHQMRITTIIINSSNFLLTARYLVQNLGLKVKTLDSEKSGIKRLYLHAASDGNVDALEVCLTNDRVVAKKFPVLLGAVAERKDQFLADISADESSIESRKVGSFENVLLFKNDHAVGHINPEVPICLVSKQILPQNIDNHYHSKEVIDWLGIFDDDGMILGSSIPDSLLHWITIKCKTVRQSIEYYDYLGFHVEDVSRDFEQETYHVATGTKIGVHLVPVVNSSVENSRVAFSVTVDREVNELPIDYKNEQKFSITNLQDAAFSFCDKHFTYDFEFADINKCSWQLHAEK